MLGKGDVHEQVWSSIGDNQAKNDRGKHRDGWAIERDVDLWDRPTLRQGFGGFGALDHVWMTTGVFIGEQRFSIYFTMVKAF
jgi:hypothetical protein